MYKIKTFQLGLLMDNDDEINTFIANEKAIPISISVQFMNDLYPDGRICNQWKEVVLIYKKELHKSPKEKMRLRTKQDEIDDECCGYQDFIDFDEY